jgi:hypothetical protein
MKLTTVVAVSRRPSGRARRALVVNVMSGAAGDLLDLAHGSSE